MLARSAFSIPRLSLSIGFSENRSALFGRMHYDAPMVLPALDSHEPEFSAGARPPPWSSA